MVYCVYDDAKKEFLLILMKTDDRLCMVVVRDHARWDEFVTGHEAGHLLQSWQWGELKATMGWKPLRVALLDGEKMVAGAQVLRRTARHLPLRLGHLAYIPRGPLLDWSQPALVDRFFATLHSLLRQQGALTLRIEPDLARETTTGEQVMRHLSALHFHPVHTIQPLRTIVINLQADEEALLARLKPKWRYNIRLAERKGVSVRVATSPEDVANWYRLYQVTGERDRFGIHTLDYYQQVWRLFSPRDEIRLLLAEREGELLAGIFVAHVARQAIYVYGASSNEQRHLMPNYALQWAALCWARQRGAHLYDLWGIPDTDAEDEAMAGVYRFKAGWGGDVAHLLGGYEYVYQPLLMRMARRWLPAGG